VFIIVVRISYFFYESNLLNIPLESDDKLKPRSLVTTKVHERWKCDCVIEWSISKEDRVVKADGEQKIEERRGRARISRSWFETRLSPSRKAITAFLFLRYRKGCAATS
jgi:hypothetical protein